MNDRGNAEEPVRSLRPLSRWLESPWLTRLLWAGIVLQACAVFYVCRPWMRSDDSRRYLELAASLAAGRFGTVTGAGFQTEAIWPPGYPLFLWFLHHKLALPIAGIVLLQLGMYLASLRLLSRFLVARAVPAAPFLVLAAAYVLTPLYIAAVMSEGLATLALTWFALALSSERLSPLRLVAIGAVSGLVTLVRPDFLLLPLLAGGMVVLRGLHERHSLAPLAGKALIPLLTAAALLTPYAAWNAAHFGKFSPIPAASAIGTSLYLATWQEKLPAEDLDALYDQRATDAVKRSGLAAEVERLNGQIGAPPLVAPWNPMNYDTVAAQMRSTKVLRRAALERIKADPADYLSHVVLNGWRLWNTSRYPSLVPAPIAWGLVALSSIVTVLGLLGAALSLLRAGGWPLPAAQALVLLYPAAIHVWLHTEARYTASVRLLLLMNAAAFLWWAFERLSRRRDGTADVPAVPRPGLPSYDVGAAEGGAA